MWICYKIMIIIKDIANAWTGLESAELGFEDWLMLELMRQERLDHLAKKFKHKCDIHEFWSSDKENLLEVQDFKRRYKLNEVKALIKKHKAFESNLEVHKECIEQIINISNELNTLNYHNRSSINTRYKHICDKWDLLGRLTLNRREALEEAERILEYVDWLFYEYSNRAESFNNWMDKVRINLLDMIAEQHDHYTMNHHEFFDDNNGALVSVVVYELFGQHDEIFDLQRHYRKFRSESLPKAEELRAISALWEEARYFVQQNGLKAADNPYTLIQVNELSANWTYVNQRHPTVLSSLRVHLALKRKFKQKCDIHESWSKSKGELLKKIAFEIEKLKLNDITALI